MEPGAANAAADGALPLVTAVLEVVPGTAVRARWDLTGDETFFAGHFPGRPTLPGVLMVASLARVASLGLGAGHGRTDAVSWSVEKARFRRQVLPGESLTLDVSLDDADGSTVRARGVAAVDGETACQVTLLLSCAAAPE